MAESIERFPVSEKGYSLPINEVLTGRGFVTGKSGSGKSNTASVVAEELLDRGLGLMIIDTDGEYAALKDRYELLQVGADDQCDREVTAEDAPLIADLALEENVPIILDVSGYMDEEVADDVIHAVVRELFVAEKQHQKPFLLFVEEAHEFIPERGGGDDIHKMLVRVAKRGRKRGLGVMAMSQRPAAVAKDYITQCDWLVWHRLTWENDTKVAGRILGGDASESVQSLDDGEALVMTDWDEKISRVQFRRKKTIDKGSTPTLHDAYGPPSAREDHVTQPPEGEGDGEASDDAAEGGTDGTATADAEADGDETTDGAQTAGAGSAQDRTSNWDLDDVDIEPIQPSLEEASQRPPEATEPQGQATGDPVQGESGTPSPDATGTGTRPNENHQVTTGAGPSNHAPNVTEGGATPGADAGHYEAESSHEAETPEPGGHGATTKRRPQLNEPDEYDPLWEIAQFIVYCYSVLANAHAALYRRFRHGYTDLCLSIRRSAFGTYQHGRTGRAERRVGTALATVTMLVLYAFLAGAVVVGLLQYRSV